MTEDTPAVEKLFCGVISVAVSEGHHPDRSGSAIIEALSGAGHNPLYYKVVMPEKNAIKAELKTALANDGLKAIILNGGTGIGENDHSIELVLPILNKQLPGFAELFRMLSFKEVGSEAAKWRALAGVSGDKLVFVLPGEPTAVKLAMDQLIIPELGSLVTELIGDVQNESMISDDICRDEDD